MEKRYVRTSEGLYTYELYQDYWVCVCLDTMEDFILFPEEHPVFW